MRVVRKVELIAIGDELLNGLRANSHLVYLGEKLQSNGLRLAAASEVPDEPEDIAASINLALSRSSLVLVTGGLGPTKDDYTVDSVAAALKRPTYGNQEVEASIRTFFQKLDRQPTTNNWKQCSIIQGAEVLHNNNGTAPGQWIEANDCIIALLPGPPRELIPMFEEQILPRLMEMAWANPVVSPIEIRTMGVGESRVADLLEPLFEAVREEIRVAYCAHLSYVDVRITPMNPAMGYARLRSLGEECRKLLGPGFLGYGTPDVAEVILQKLRSLNKSLAVAESCTGGMVGSRFTDIPGASKVFKGGVICYNNEIKESLLGIPDSLLEQHGAVSAECAVAMATAVAEIMETDYALSITGFAGPEGGNEPAGTIYFGYHSPVGVWSRRVILPGTRSAVKERAVLTALDFIRRKLEKYQMYDLLESLKC